VNAGRLRTASFVDWRAATQQAVELALSNWVSPDAPAGLGDAMRYAVLDGGKRLRPLLVLATSEPGRDAAAAMRAACAVELIHAYSLVHDDMPCMDNDVLRRGKPTVHVRFGEAQALLAGDALQALAFELLVPEDGSVAPAWRSGFAACWLALPVPTAWPVGRRSTWPVWAGLISPPWKPCTGERPGPCCRPA
jgi:geranylgeranyl pyrophosphate synthase